MDVSSFDRARLIALKQYAELELELVGLLRAILVIDHSIASAIFFQITNTRSRYAIIASILDIKYPDTWKKPWKKLESWLGPIDSARNHLVHWLEDESIVARVSTDGTLVRKVERVPHLANSARKWRRFTPGEKRYQQSDILLVAESARIMGRIINRLNATIDQPETWPWLEIFQQPITDQTPEAFLSRLNDKGHPAQLPPYQW